MLILLKKPGIEQFISVDPYQVSAVDYNASLNQCYVYVGYRPYTVEGSVEEVTQKINAGRKPAVEIGSLDAALPCRRRTPSDSKSA